MPTKPVVNADTGRESPGKKTRKMKALSAEDTRALLELAKAHDPKLYRRITAGNFIRAKVLVERRIYR